MLSKSCIFCYLVLRLIFITWLLRYERFIFRLFIQKWELDLLLRFNLDELWRLYYFAFWDWSLAGSLVLDIFLSFLFRTLWVFQNRRLTLTLLLRLRQILFYFFIFKLLLIIFFTLLLFLLVWHLSYLWNLKKLSKFKIISR